MLNLSNKIKKIPRVPKVKNVKSFEEQYATLVGEIVENIREHFEKLVLPYLEQISLSAQAEGLFIKKDSWDDQLEQLMTSFNLSLSREMDINRTKITIQLIGASVNKQNSEELQRIIKQMFNIDIRNYEPWLKSSLSSFLKEGISLVKDLSAKTEKDLFTLIQKDIKQGKRVETIKKEILTGTDLKAGYFNSVKTRAELVARDQVGKLNGQLSRLRQKDIGITLYIWRTSDDERVRESHRVLADKVCSWADPSVYADTIEDAIDEKWKQRSSIGAFIGDPGEDYQCRCNGEPVFDTILEK
jgi:SPP1 gp7 family putative phage head morphogenesis protein